MDRKGMAMKGALRGLMSELGGMNMDRARKRKNPPPDSDLGEKKDADLPDLHLNVYRGEKKMRGKLHRVRMGDPDMDD